MHNGSLAIHYWLHVLLLQELLLRGLYGLWNKLLRGNRAV